MEKKKYSITQNIAYCIRNTRDCYPLLLLWCLLLVGTNVLIPVLNMFLPKVVIEKITSGDSLEQLVAATLIFTVVLAIFSGLQRFLEKYVYWHKHKMNTFYMHKVAGKGLTTDYANQENESFRQLQSESFACCNGNFSPVTEFYDVLTAFVSSMLGFLVYFGILAQLNIFIILFLIATTLLSTYLNKQIIKWSEDNNKEKIRYGQRMMYISNVSGDFRSAKDIRLYRMAGWLEQVYRNNIMGLAGWYHRYMAKLLGVSIIDSGLSLLREGAAYAYLLYLVLASRISVAEFVLYFGAITGFSVWLGGILGHINSLNRIHMSLNHLRTYLEYPECYKREGGIEAGCGSTLPKTIELIDVSYRYEGSDTDTLRHINLKIAPGEHLAVVGLNGAGKTTLIKLICGLTDPTEGSVLYDGINVKEYNRRSYYRLFAAVFQQFSILPVTVAEIVAEAVSEHVDQRRVKECLNLSGLWEKVNSLPKGINSQFGKTIYDDGTEFSGGEVQKLLLARALYKSAPILLLDEPTAALDPVSESRLYETYSQIMEDRSTVFISHRLASTRFCSRILLLDGGHITEEGSHEQLLAQKGRYYELFETQARYYREHPGEEEVDVQ